MPWGSLEGQYANLYRSRRPPAGGADGVIAFCLRSSSVSVQYVVLCCVKVVSCRASSLEEGAIVNDCIHTGNCILFVVLCCVVVVSCRASSSEEGAIVIHFSVFQLT